jgi:hypothetical protein
MSPRTDLNHHPADYKTWTPVNEINNLANSLPKSLAILTETSIPIKEKSEDSGKWHQSQGTSFAKINVRAGLARGFPFFLTQNRGYVVNPVANMSQKLSQICRKN